MICLLKIVLAPSQIPYRSHVFSYMLRDTVLPSVTTFMHELQVENVFVKKEGRKLDQFLFLNRIGKKCEFGVFSVEM